MANNNLEFLKTFQVEDFKEMVGSEKISVSHNAQTGKFFFSAVTKSGEKISGKCSDKGAPETDKAQISWCRDKTNEEKEPFWLLHNEATSNIVKTY